MMRALLYVTALIVCSLPSCWCKIVELTDIEVEYAGFFRDTILNKHYHNNKGNVCILQRLSYQMLRFKMG